MNKADGDQLAHEIRAWIEKIEHRFTNRELDEEVGVASYTAKGARRALIKRMCDAGELERIPNLPGTYRKVDGYAPEIDWQSADAGRIVPLKFPFGLEKYAKIFPKSIVIVAGSKEAGKTAFLYNVLIMNMLDFEIELFNSETGREQMKNRLLAFNVDIPNPAPFSIRERYSNFADVIHPDKISIIDYLDVESETYLVGQEISRIFRKLKNGVAIIGLQKPIGRDLGYGKDYSAMRAILYLVLDRHKLKILYAKEPADPTIDPHNMTWSFNKIKNGVEFINPQQSWQA